MLGTFFSRSRRPAQADDMQTAAHNLHVITMNDYYQRVTKRREVFGLSAEYANSVMRNAATLYLILIAQ